MGGGVPLDLFAVKGLLEAWYRGMGLDAPRIEGGAAEATGGALGTESFRLVHPEGGNGVAGRVSRALARRADVPEDLWLFSIDFDRCVKLDREPSRYRELSRFPAVKRDIALIVSDGVAHADLEACIRSAGGGLVSRVELFDLYQGDPIPAGKKSLAYALSFQSPERSLVSDEVDRLVDSIVSALGDGFGAVLRDG
jgi:phenylalanyl-tRNA synthetase beta chain